MVHSCQTMARRVVRYGLSFGAAETGGVLALHGVGISLPIIVGFNPLYFTVTFVGFIFCVVLHEYAHAWMATRLGDDLARRQGRLTLRPMAHIEPLSLLLALFFSLGFIPLAWAKPVPVNALRLRGGRISETFVALAGPLVNLLLGVVLALVIRFGGLSDTALGFILIRNKGTFDVAGFAAAVLLYLCQVNLFLFAFNLIPIPPLDGWNILRGFLPSRWVVSMGWLERYGVAILLAVIFFLPIILPNRFSPLGWLSNILVYLTGLVLF